MNQQYLFVSSPISLKQPITVIAWLLMIMILPAVASSQEQSFSSMAFRNIAGDTVRLNSYQGKKTIVLIFDAGRPDDKTLAMMMSIDTLYRAGTINAIAIPMSDNGNMMKNDALRYFLTSALHISFPITEVSRVRKSNGSNQHPLCRWLTDAHLNGHFNDDIINDGHFFIIRESGELYANVNAVNDKRDVSALAALLAK